MTEFIKKGTFTIILATLLLVSCNYNRYKSQPDIWNNLDITTNTPIRNMYAGPTELLIMTDDEFIRVDNQNQVKERRVFPDLPFNFFGRPTLSRYVFTRVVTQDYPDPDAPGQIIKVNQLEVHLTKDFDSSETVNLNLDQFAEDNEISIVPEDKGRYNGAFDTNGDLFLLPTLNITDNTYSFFLFNINLNLSKDAFVGTGVTLNKRIDLPLDDIDGDIMNTSFINGFFYINSKWGTYRLDPDTGDYIEINKIWTLNAFEHKDKIFLTGFNDFDFYQSDDNGQSFEQVGTSSLKFVEVENGNIFSQSQLGLPWSLADEDMLGAEELRVNKSFEDDGASYWNVRYFYGRYYISIQKEVYFLEDLETE